MVWLACRTPRFAGRRGRQALQAERWAAALSACFGQWLAIPADEYQFGRNAHGKPAHHGCGHSVAGKIAFFQLSMTEYDARKSGEIRRPPCDLRHHRLLKLAAIHRAGGGVMVWE
jgi:hypothetical protein